MPRQAYFLDPGNAERCSRCHVRPAPGLKPTRAELAEATQSSQAKLMQELSADHYGSLSPKPIRWRHSKRSPHSENKAFFALKQLVAAVGLVLSMQWKQKPQNGYEFEPRQLKRSGSSS